MTATLAASNDTAIARPRMALLRTGALATLLAAGATELYAAALRGAGVHLAIGGIELLRPVHHHPEHPRMRPVDQQA